MVPVGCDDRVVGRRARVQPSDDSLLSVIQVAEAPDVLALVERVEHDFHTPHSVHGLEPTQELIFARVHSGGRGCTFVCVERSNLYVIEVIMMIRILTTMFIAAGVMFQVGGSVPLLIYGW